ncbi:hypothetical protein M2368_002953 [Arthrobacter sp. JUb119]|nr:hypothetical protein [Arthrobacter sp. JUb119]TDU26987.1 hypothetical protein EDF61_10459 [Arthrobacter sp. JUb115]
MGNLFGAFIVDIDALEPLKDFSAFAQLKTVRSNMKFCVHSLDGVNAGSQ